MQIGERRYFRDMLVEVTGMGYLLSVLFVLIAGLPVAAQVSSGTWRTDTTKASISLNELLPGGPPKDGIPSIDRPTFVPVKRASWLAKKELVIAFEQNGVARAYPLQILMWHELVNDVVNQVPILVSYCPLCNSAIVFDRRVDGATFEFGVSGMLRNSDMVMFDRQTDSLWQQITGEALVGAHTGRQLKMLSAQVVPFEEFARAYPEGMVLSRETGFQRDYGRNPYSGYEYGVGPIMPVRQPRKLPVSPMEKLVVVKGQDGYLAIPFKILSKRGVWEGSLDGEPIVVLHSPEGLSPLDDSRMSQSRNGGTAGAFYAELAGRSAAFQRTKIGIEDVETGSLWSVGGLAIRGPRAGARLRPVVHGVYFAFAWLAFQPETRIVGESEKPDR